MRISIIVILVLWATTGQGQTYNNNQLSTMVRALQTQMSAANGKIASQDAAISSLTTKVNNQATIITIQNSTISTLQNKITAQQIMIDNLRDSQKEWRPTWMNPNDFKVINGPTADSVSIIRLARQ